MGIITIPKPLREKLGDDGTEGLIEVLNRQEEHTQDSVIETAADRFERRLTEVGAGLDNRIIEVESGLRVEISDAEKRFERRLTEESSRLDKRITEVESGLRVEIQKSKTDTIKWMFVFYIGQVAALGGILFAVLR
jgi:bifunctional DNA-binding transcriptional regulator/antitoxin component of YhaV-PrlF toxin-antitoxin module